MATIHIVVGYKTRQPGEKPTQLYLGTDGAEAMAKAKEAQESGEYENGNIHRQVIYRWIPCATVPVGNLSAAKGTKKRTEALKVE